MSRIAIITLGTVDEVRPVIALARELIKRGEDVRVASASSHASVAEGVPFFHLAADEHAALLEEAARAAGPAQPDLYRNFFERTFSSWAMEGSRACDGADCVLGLGTATYAAACFAEALNAPFIECMLCPSALLSPGHVVAKSVQAFWRVQERAIDSILRPALNLAPYSKGGPHRWLRERQAPILCGFPPAFAPGHASWPHYIHVSGFWLSHPASSWQPPDELSRFLQQGEPPIYIELGCSGRSAAERSLAMAVEAAVRGRRRAVVVSPNPPQLHSAEPWYTENVLFMREISRPWILERVSLAVHGGGSDIVGDVLMTGTPSVVLPLEWEEFFWAGLLAERELAAPPVPAHATTSANVLAAIAVAGEERIRVAVKNWVRQFSTRGGAAHAAEIVQRVAAGGRSLAKAAEARS
jgi:UDP:flavonoid glycosyltransferase YjiC (YdhE family)